RRRHAPLYPLTGRGCRAGCTDEALRAFGRGEGSPCDRAGPDDGRGGLAVAHHAWRNPGPVRLQPGLRLPVVATAVAIVVVVTVGARGLAAGVDGGVPGPAVARVPPAAGWPRREAVSRPVAVAWPVVVAAVVAETGRAGIVRRAIRVAAVIARSGI